MYAKRVQIINYGPIEQLDIELPFDGDLPKPVVLVGGNGSGKSILLSHIVNGLVSAKDHVYTETPEVEAGKVFKIRHDSYIRTGGECYFAKVDFEDGMSIAELRLRRSKREYDSVPSDLTEGDAKTTWDKMAADTNDHMESNLFRGNTNKIEGLLSKNCVLYFPSDRFEEPAWLNEENLLAQAEYMGLRRLQGHTTRKVINYSPLRDNQNWLFDVLYDRAVLETQTVRFPMPIQDSGQSFPLPVQVGPTGDATSMYAIALQVVQRVMKDSQDARFGIGRRRSRVVSVEGVDGTLVPNIFQLSSGETALLDLFLAILRDSDISGATFTSAADIRGIVVVDEIDLHLHAVHQHEILPSLMRMFPKVQFIVTTHSPLFVLGLAQTYGEEGFALYRMPQGQQISPEEFSEFEDAYQAFKTTSTFSDEIRTAVQNAQNTFLYMEGTTDEKYLRRASQLLNREELLASVEIQDGKGIPGLKNIWSAVSKLPDDLVPRKTVLLFDCEYEGPAVTQGNKHRLKIPSQNGHPIEKGIENLFSRETLMLALSYKPEFIDIADSHQEKIRGEVKIVPEKWDVNEDEKTNLCNWLCENGTTEDFEHFRAVFDLLEGVLGSHENEECSSA